MRKIIITDLTRFSNNDSILCTAGIDINTHQCIRLTPYLKTKKCMEWNMFPGAILTGNLYDDRDAKSPHIEDMQCKKLEFHGHCSSSEFRNILSESAHQSIEDGFEVSLANNQKCIPSEANPARSLITISINPQSIQIAKSNYDSSKIIANITDNSGKEYKLLSITDFGLHKYIEKYRQEIGDYSSINDLIHAQDEVFLRIGIGRFFKASKGKEGFWMQVNGIYSFPQYFKPARQYG